MQPSRSWKGGCVRFAAGILIMLGSVGLLAQNTDKKTPPPPPKPAAPAKPPASARPPAPQRPPTPPPSRPSGGSSSSSGHSPSSGGGAHTGPTTSSPSHSGATASHTGPTTSHSGPAATGSTSGHRGPTANSPGVKHSGPTTGGANANGTKTPGAANAHRPDVGKAPSAGSGHAANSGPSARPAPRTTKQAQHVQLKNGSVLQKRPNGKVSDVHDAKRGMDVHHGINGSKRVIVERPDHTRIVAERGRPGYIQRGYTHNGHAYARRTYYYGGRSYNRYYRGYPYRGVYLNVYAPALYYPPAFYGWAYNPWYRPVVYPWGWVGNPWYGYYGYYFTPYTYYPSAAFWLTDYVISTSLAAAYQEQQEASQDAGPPPQASGGSPELTPAMKEMIANEVKNQLAVEKAEAQQNAQNQEPDPSSSGIAQLLSDKQTHVFVVGSSLDVVDASGNQCALSDGDVLNMAAPAAPDVDSVDLVVMASKGGRECPKSDTVTVALADLQDMQNHMRETIDQGLQELQAKQGTGGLPTAPPAADAPPVDAGIAKDAPPPDPNGAAEVNQEMADADQAEKEVTDEAQQETGPSTPPPDAPPPAQSPATITLGQSVDEVTAILGPPLTVIDLGAKKIYKYQDMKITFKDGKVSDVE